MNALPIILGLGALYFVTKKSEPQTKKKSDIVLVGKPVKIDCLKNQYTDKNGKCQFFWTDGETDKIVEKELTSQLTKLNLKITSDSKTWDAVCLDSSETQANPNYILVVKNIITKLWPQVTKDQLPPGKNSPDWLKEIWKRVSKIYYWKTCGITI
jgi:hypothetical protein